MYKLLVNFKDNKICVDFITRLLSLMPDIKGVTFTFMEDDSEISIPTHTPRHVVDFTMPVPSAEVYVTIDDVEKFFEKQGISMNNMEFYFKFPITQIGLYSMRNTITNVLAKLWVVRDEGEEK